MDSTSLSAIFVHYVDLINSADKDTEGFIQKEVKKIETIRYKPDGSFAGAALVLSETMPKAIYYTDSGNLTVSQDGKTFSAIDIGCKECFNKVLQKMIETGLVHD